MTTEKQPAPGRHPATWIPTLYFAEGLPFFAVALIAGLMYKSRGVPNDQIARYTSLLGFVWVFKPLWSPFLETFKTKKFIVVLFQLLGGLSLALVGLALPLSGYFVLTIALLGLVAICAATHDIAADGLYIASLSTKQQAEYSGWLGGFFNVARFFSQGALVILAGYLEARMDVAKAWMVIFCTLGAIMMCLGLYHSAMLPKGGAERRSETFRDVMRTLWDVIASFLQKPNIWLLIAFIILFRAGEGQVMKIGPLFLRDARAAGGLGLTTDQVGSIYGFAGSLAFIGGSILGGYFTAWLGLRRALFPLICAMNVPNLAYVYLSTSLPTGYTAVTTALMVEMFGYGFGFVGLILLMMQEVAPGKYQTAHYSLATGFMQLGFVLFGMVSGDIQTRLGYRNFFIWVLISAIPALILSRFIPLRHQETGASTPAQPTAAEA